MALRIVVERRKNEFCVVRHASILAIRYRHDKRLAIRNVKRLDNGPWPLLTLVRRCISPIRANETTLRGRFALSGALLRKMVKPQITLRRTIPLKVTPLLSIEASLPEAQLSTEVLRQGVCVRNTTAR